MREGDWLYLFRERIQKIHEKTQKIREETEKLREQNQILKDLKAKDLLRNSIKPEYKQIMDDYFAQNQPPSLYARFYDWVDTADLSQSRDSIAEELVRIVEEFLPKVNDTNTHHWNKCLDAVKEKLR